jgi:hypothetical protein
MSSTRPPGWLRRWNGIAGWREGPTGCMLTCAAADTESR